MKKSHSEIGVCLDHQNQLKQRQLETITEYVSQSKGLLFKWKTDHLLQILQRTDGKTICFDFIDIEDVIPRCDAEGQDFLQVNFSSGKKILLTDQLVGFKPFPCGGLDMAKLPKVVTTPDILSVLEAIEETLASTRVRPEEVEVLKRVFDSVMKGAELVGFDTTPERVWLSRAVKNSEKITA